jgi:hypothetical protein
MIMSLLLGALLVLATFFIHAAGIVGLTALFGDGDAEKRTPYLVGIRAMLLLVFGLFLLLMIEVGVWALAFVWIGFFDDLETAVYFSTSTFATVGFGDVAPAHDWRLLAAIEGIAGFLIIGWSSAFLVAAGVRVGPFRRGVHF